MIEGFEFKIGHEHGVHDIPHDAFPFFMVPEYLGAIQDVTDLDVEEVKSIFFTAAAPVLFAAVMSCDDFMPVAEGYLTEDGPCALHVDVSVEQGDTVFYTRDGVPVTVGYENGEPYTEIDMKAFMSNIPSSGRRPTLIPENIDELPADVRQAMLKVYPQTENQQPIWSGMTPADRTGVMAVTMLFMEDVMETLLTNQM